MMAVLAPAPHAEALAELIGYLQRAGVEPTRPSLASLATDRGVDDDAVRDLLDQFDRQEAGRER